MLEIAKHDYEQFIKSYGFNSAYTIQYGLEYAKMLRNAARGIEAERPFRSWQQTAAACTVQSTTALNVHIKILRYARCAGFLFLLCLTTTKCFRLCDTKMVENCVSSQAPSQSQGRWTTRGYFMLRVIS